MVSLKKILILFTALFSIITQTDLVASELTTLNDMTCPICIEPLANNHYQLSCAHSSCLDCFHKLTTCATKEKDTHLLACPQCDNSLTEKDLQHICPDAETQKKIIALLKFKEARKNPNFKRCPTIDCGGYFVNIYGVGKIIQCEECTQSYCSACLKRHKQNISCEKFEQMSRPLEPSSSSKKGKGRAVSQDPSYDWIAKNTKNCPNCQTTIEKKGGCKKMHCYDCKHVFTWEE